MVTRTAGPGFGVASTNVPSDIQLLERLLACVRASAAGESAARLIDRFGGLAQVLEASGDELALAGLDDGGINAILMVHGIIERHLIRKAETSDPTSDPTALRLHWQFRIGPLRHEVFEVALLDPMTRLLPDGVVRLASGTVDRSVVFPRQIVIAALRREAVGVILAHNHPNGVLEPTERDRLLTRAVVLAAETVDLRILDHIIVSSTASFSFKAAGML